MFILCQDKHFLVLFLTVQSANITWCVIKHARWQYIYNWKWRHKIVVNELQFRLAFGLVVFVTLWFTWQAEVSLRLRKRVSFKLDGMVLESSNWERITLRSISIFRVACFLFTCILFLPLLIALFFVLFFFFFCQTNFLLLFYRSISFSALVLTGSLIERQEQQQ